MSDLILALDCSLRWTSVAVFSARETSASEQSDLGRRQAAELPLATERVLAKAGRALGDVGLMAVTNGPGYFTGIRVGVAYAAALAYGLGIKVVPVGTLSMLSYAHASRQEAVLAVVYAGRGFVYAASYGADENLPVGEYPGDALKLWLDRHENIAVVSDDPQKACEAAGLTRPVEQVLPDAAVVARIAWDNAEAAVSPMDLRVDYHRLPQGVVP